MFLCHPFMLWGTLYSGPCIFWCHFCYPFVFFQLGNNLSNTDFTFLATINSADNMTDVVLGVNVLHGKLLKNFEVYLHLLAFFNALLNVPTNHSACPFDLEWYGRVVICSMKNILQKSSNSLPVNWVPLSETMVSGMSYLANSSCKKITVTSKFPFSATINYHKIMWSIHRTFYCCCFCGWISTIEATSTFISYSMNFHNPRYCYKS